MGYASHTKGTLAMTRLQKEAYAYSLAAPFLRELREKGAALTQKENMRIKARALMGDVLGAQREMEDIIERRRSGEIKGIV